MKTIDVSSRVMKKVVLFERRRITMWLRGFITLTVFLVSGGVMLVGLVVRDLMEKRAFDMFELFTQDLEIIAEFWKEVLVTFWEEVPQRLFFIAIGILILLVLLIIVTRRKRLIIDKKLHALEKFL